MPESDPPPLTNIIVQICRDLKPPPPSFSLHGRAEGNVRLRGVNKNPNTQIIRPTSILVAESTTHALFSRNRVSSSSTHK